PPLPEALVDGVVDRRHVLTRARPTFQYRTWCTSTASVSTSWTCTTQSAPTVHAHAKHASTTGWTMKSTPCSQHSAGVQRRRWMGSSFVTNRLEKTASTTYTVMAAREGWVAESHA